MDGLVAFHRSPEYTQEASAFNICQVEALPVTSKAVQQPTHKNPLLSKVLHNTKRGWPDQVSDAMKPFLSRQHELSVEDECLLWEMRVIIPGVLQAQMLKEDLFRPSNRLWLQASMMDRHCSITRTTFFSHIAPPFMQPQKSLHVPCSLAGTSELELNLMC